VIVRFDGDKVAAIERLQMPAGAPAAVPPAAPPPPAPTT
jgi:hypothetical protein